MQSLDEQANVTQALIFGRTMCYYFHGINGWGLIIIFSIIGKLLQFMGQQSLRMAYGKANKWAILWVFVRVFFVGHINKQ